MLHVLFHFRKLFSTNGNILLCTGVLTIVVADKVTRLAMPTTDVIGCELDSIRPIVNQSRYTPHDMKPGSHKTSYRVRWSDIDAQQHVNQAQFVRISLDAATEACCAG